MAKRGIQLQCSEHAKQRIKERMGITENGKIKKLTKEAYHTGLCMKKNYIPMDTLKYIKRKVDTNYFGRCSAWRIHNGYLFLFSKSLTLVTVYELPNHLKQKNAKSERSGKNEKIGNNIKELINKENRG